MTDTNWCTFCDCKINPCSNSIYCSEDCYRQDASSYPLFDTQQQHIIQKEQSPTVKSLEPIMLMPPDSTSYLQPKSISSSVCSEDLAAMYIDMIPPTPPLDDTKADCYHFTPCTPPISSSHSSAASIHALIDTPNTASNNFIMREKLNSVAPLSLYTNNVTSHSIGW